MHRRGAETAGDYGPATKDAVLVFLCKNGLSSDGVAGPETLRTLASYRFAPDEAVEAVDKVGAMETPEARQGTPVAAGLGAPPAWP